MNYGRLCALAACLVCLAAYTPLARAAVGITDTQENPGSVPLDGYGFKYAHLSIEERIYQGLPTPEEKKGGARKTTKSDPWERWNRGAQRFNDWGDTYLLRPVAVAYKTVTPSFFRNRTDDFVENLKTPVYMTHSLLQGNLSHVGLHLFRFLVNTTFGLFGLFDVAKIGELPEAPTGFADTFRAWGIGEGHYLVLPARPPGSVLDNIGGILDIWLNVVAYSDIEHWQTLAVLDTLNKRVELLSVDHILRSGGDRYSLTRDLYYALKESNTSTVGTDDEVTEEDLEAIFDDTF
jgi:phospholipid-binding lipoprotein MlaA